jgi:hypothetical protein
MRPARVFHEVERFSKLHEPIEENFRALIMDVVITWAMHDQQFFS